MSPKAFDLPRRLDTRLDRCLSWDRDALNGFVVSRLALRLRDFRLERFRDFRRVLRFRDFRRALRFRDVCTELRLRERRFDARVRGLNILGPYAGRRLLEARRPSDCSCEVAEGLDDLCRARRFMCVSDMFIS